jgi:GT2 family glycosyltransferase
MRVDALQEVGSFRAEMVAGEEPELCFRLRQAGWEIWRIDAKMTEHDAKISSFGQWWRRAARGGFGYAQAWHATRVSSTPLYGRQIASVLFWILFVPATVGIGALLTRTWWILLLLPLAYALQVLRIASTRSRARTLGYRLKSAVVTMITKFAELKGIATFWLKGRTSPGVTYKEKTAQIPRTDQIA